MACERTGSVMTVLHPATRADSCPCRTVIPG